MEKLHKFDRLSKVIGDDNVLLLSEKTVLVLGVGGVGGYVVESLARSSIGHLILVDFDKVDITNINRQIIATHDNDYFNHYDGIIKIVPKSYLQNKEVEV